MRVLVTGGAGFIGSSLCEYFLSEGMEVVCLDNFATGYEKNIASLRGVEGFSCLEGDIQNFTTCLAACQGVDYVFHEAALASVPESIDKPLETNSINVGGFVNILEACRRQGVKRLIYASSSAVYGDCEALPSREENIGRAISPYGFSKRVNEQYADLYARVYGLESIGLRYFNVYGERQDPQREYACVIPIFVKTFLEHKTPRINGDGTITRDFTYIQDVVQANALAMKTTDLGAVNRVYNVASGESFTLNQLVDFICEALREFDGEIANIGVTYGPFREGDVPHTAASLEAIERYLGYKSGYTLREGLRSACLWYREHLL